MASQERIEAIETKLRHFGGSLDPHAAFLLHRGMKTLALRVRQQNTTALELAQFLANRDDVAAVNYPGLRETPGHENAATLLDGYGGMLSLELPGGINRAEAFMDALRLPISAPSLGGVESLVTRPAATSHRSVPHSDRLEMGIKDRLVRMSIGIENTGDLIEDVERALNTVRD